MDSKDLTLFDSEVGRRVYAAACTAVKDFSMDARFMGGVLVGLSGGADSVMLIRFLEKYRRDNTWFPIVAVHVNHCIRGDEALRDELFSGELCESLGIEFIARRADVPAIAKNEGKSLEETARNVRYSIFREIISGRDDISTVAVAHNSDDNFETVLMNMMRGAGVRGVAGISPVRDDIVRPLIYVPKSDIIGALDAAEIKFVTDSTNESDDYTRNYIRHNIIPRFLTAFPSAFSAVERMSKNLREDDECLNSIAADFAARYENGNIPTAELASLKPALLFRVLNLYFSNLTDRTLERTHVSAIKECLGAGGEFSLSLPRGIRFVAKNSVCGFTDKADVENKEFCLKISEGENNFSDFGIKIVLKRASGDENSSNVYNISTHPNLSSAIIIGGLFIRNRLDGDTCFYGGMTHKLKKLFNDRKIPAEIRSRIPVLCDESGVVWVPGFGVRDDGADTGLEMEISLTDFGKNQFYLPEVPGRRKNKKGKKVT